MLNFLWFRNDLRLTDNKVIEFAYNKGINLVPVYILDTDILSKKYISPARISFLYSCLISLDKYLRNIGSKLLILEGQPKIIWKEIASKNIINILASKDYSTFSKRRDSEVTQVLQSCNSAIQFIKNNVVFDKDDEITNTLGEPITVFTSFKKAWLNKLKNNIEILNFNYDIKRIFLSANEIDNICKELDIQTKDLNDLKNNSYQIENSYISWNNFKNTKIFEYSKNRNFLNLDSTSKLSKHLKFGTISPFRIAKDCIDLLGENFVDFRRFHNTEKEGVEAFLSEIIWREFYKYILDNFPHVVSEPFQRKYKNIEWDNDKEKFDLWKKGLTGYPIVDACMRQLNTENWMHNRGRMIVASFLCKDLHINWQWGEKYFREKLIDYDLSANNGGWQWVAGTGTDAAPYFRIFNPVEQSKKFDPQGSFIKKYVPELRNVPQEYIHEPWLMPLELQNKIRVIIGKDYPKPIVDHTIERKVALQRYKII